MVTALENGADRIIPLKCIDEARARRAEKPHFLLGGERDAKRPKDFDLGNSPLEYCKRKVEGKSIIMTTTNGTAAIEAASRAGADTIIVGALLNRSAVVEYCRGRQESVLLVCAGTRGRFSLEDAVCAGAIIKGLGSHTQLSDAARVCLTLYEAFGKNSLTNEIMASRHGRYLQEIGYGKDIEFATRMDRSPIVPLYHEGEIRALETAAVEAKI
ncbi:MAG: 2-phosphosulfolactate phosphatase [Firmicutes bacterium]|nr:2-phosphosulfolactate phosphatase [Bacillota bacterium]